MSENTISQNEQADGPEDERESEALRHHIPDAFLHVYGQFIYHADAVIRGTPAALRLLQAAITEALENGKGEAEVLATDGEGYSVVVVASNTVAGIGRPEYRHDCIYEVADMEYRRWANVNKLIGGWDIPPADDGEPP